MKIMAICGSKRKNGNTVALIEKTLEPFRKEKAEITTFFPGEMNIEGCRGCEGCAKTGICIIQDDMQEAYKALQTADAVIAGSPTYFYNVTGDMKKFIDRCYCFFSFDKSDRSVWTSRLERTRRKVVGIIAICEQSTPENIGFTAKSLEMAFRSLGFRIVFTQRVLHAFKAGEVNTMGDILDESRLLGERLLKTLKLLYINNITHGL